MIAFQINGSNGHAKAGRAALSHRSSKKERVIPHREAFKILLSSMASESLPDHISAELPAIISHWLNRPTTDPVIIHRSFGDKWRTQLSAYSRLTSEPFMKLSFRKPSKRVDFRIDFSDRPFSPPARPRFTFIDLFAGIGGFRIALQKLGGKCVFSSELDEHAQETYYNNFAEIPFGDIRQFTAAEITEGELKRTIPNSDVLAAGFPCQPFSRAGVSARNALGQQHGFLCEIQGTLFFDIIRIAKATKPKVLLLENVGNIMRHDEGHTFETIKSHIEDLGYHFYHRVYNAKTLVPQSRVRCLIVAFRKKPRTDWRMPELAGTPLPLRNILQKIPADTSYTLSDRMWNGHIRRSNRNVARGTGFTAYPKDLDKPSTTLVARYYKDGKECLIPQQNHPRGVPRMLTERECARLQGFPESFIPHPSRIRAYKQFGNSVPVPLIDFVASSFRDQL